MRVHGHSRCSGRLLKGAVIHTRMYAKDDSPHFDDASEVHVALAPIKPFALITFYWGDKSDAISLSKSGISQGHLVYEVAGADGELKFVQATEMKKLPTDKHRKFQGER